MTEFTHRIMVSVPDGAPYDAARLAMASLTGAAGDASAHWRQATDGTQTGGEWNATHRVASMLARNSDVLELDALALATGGSWCILVRDRDTTPVRVMTASEALASFELWLLEFDEQGTPSRVYR